MKTNKDSVNISPSETTDSINRLPDSVWEQLINAPLADNHMRLLTEAYPISLIEKFLELLSKEKESITICIQNKLEKILEQLRSEMTNENENQKQNNEDVNKKYDYWFNILQELNAAKQSAMRESSRSDENVRLCELNKYIEADIEILHNQNKKLADHGNYLTKEIKYMYDKCFQQEQKLQEINHLNDQAKTKIIKDIEILSQKIDEKSLQLQNLRSPPAVDSYRSQCQ
ncbi:uncharacterized protein LOC123293509 [Chrysoperla carnea]|uniref:uncharacterized protein LOC123293509 n=1 Tax=Chrysoperla carnea TaxID=189513 RepID=UPI001D06969E|nr:uncharacterized protein LOC123293509 [Chrysoperla carnea]